MTKPARLVVLSIIGALLVAATWYLIAIGPGPAWTQVMSRLSPAPATIEPSKPSAPWERNVASPPKAASRTETKAGPVVPAERPVGRAAPHTSPPAGAPPAIPEGVVIVRELGARPRRTSLYLPGQRTGWTSSDLNANNPIRLRAGGQVSIGTDRSGPSGLSGSTYERTLSRERPSGDTDAKVLPSAPYLALLGRICSGQECSAPFVIGSGMVVCPSDLNLTGTLQIWTNNYIRVDGAQTGMRFSGTSGGFWLYAEPAPADACGVRASAAASQDAVALAAGGILRKPEFTISSSQADWKPFFLPMREPLLIRASGSMQPSAGVEATGPDGIVVPDVVSWSYPGTNAVVVDADHKLFNAGLPYQALVGRLCGVKGCGPTFLVGRERTLCPEAEYGDHLELWINHIIGPRGLLGTSTPLTIDTLDIQTRIGEYRFEIASAHGGCVK